MIQEAALEVFLKKFPVFEDVPEYQKVRCTLTGHELPIRLADIQKYTETKKFKTAWAVYEIMQSNPDVFEEIGDKSVLGCRITKTTISKDPEDMKRHLEGGKFKRAMKRRAVRKERGEEESSDEEMDDEEMEEGEKEEMEKGSEGEEIEEDDDDYPELKEGNETFGGEENYDFDIMDTELEENKGGKKRSAKGECDVPAKKKKAK